MKRVLCTNPNATSPINGIEFNPIVEGLLSVPLEDSEASQFDGLGKFFTVLDIKPDEEKETATPTPALPTLEEVINQADLQSENIEADSDAEKAAMDQPQELYAALVSDAALDAEQPADKAADKPKATAKSK